MFVRSGWIFSYSSFATQEHTVLTRTCQSLKEAPGRHSDAFVKARFPMSPCSSTLIDHPRAACCMKGKCMHVREEKRAGQKGAKKWERSASFPFSLHFPLASCLHLSFSPPALFLSSPSLHRGIQSLHWERSSLKVIQSRAARCLLSPPYLPPYPSRHPIYPPPSAPTPQPSGLGGG